MSTRRTGLSRSRSGFALLAALAFLALTSVLALELSVTARGARLSAANAIELAAGKAAARAGVEDVRTRLLQALIIAGQSGQTALDPWASVVAAPAPSETVGEYRYQVILRDAGAALHLNRATEEQLRRLLVALRVDASRADQVAQAMLDWRDGDDLHRARGAERPAYLAAGRPVLPDNAPFRSVSAIRDVMGVDEALYRLLLPYLTVHGSGRVNLNAAEPAVLITLPGMTDESVALVMRYRRQGRRVTSLDALAQQLSAGPRRRLVEAMPALSAATVSDTRELFVTSVAFSSDGSERGRAEALMVRDNGVRIAWRRMSP